MIRRYERLCLFGPTEEDLADESFQRDAALLARQDRQLGDVAAARVLGSALGVTE